MTRAARWAVIAVAAAVALSGCVRVTADTSLHTDDTFSQDVVIAFSDGARDQAEQALGTDIGDLREQIEDNEGFKQLAAAYPDQVLLTDYDDGEITGVQLALTDIPLADYQDGASELTEALPVGAGASIERVDDTFVITLTATDAGDALAGAGISPSQLALIESSVDIGVTFTFPGLVESATAGTIAGKTVTLGLGDLASGQEIRIVGGATGAIDWGPILMWAGIALAFIVVVGGAAALVVQDQRRRRRLALPAPDASGESTVGTLDTTDGEAEDSPDPGPDESPTTR